MNVAFDARGSALALAGSKEQSQGMWASSQSLVGGQIGVVAVGALDWIHPPFRNGVLSVWYVAQAVSLFCPGKSRKGCIGWVSH